MHILKMRHTLGRLLLGSALTLMVLMLLPGLAPAGTQKSTSQKSFATPEKAVEALVQALRNDNKEEIKTLFGSDGASLISQGGDAADKERKAKFIKLYEEKSRLETKGKAKVILHVGNKDWPFPVPLVESGKTWRFDTKQGKKEVIRRRIGRNELDTIQACLAIVDAQREYVAVDRNSDGLLEYAQKFASTRGLKDGLYWEAKPGEEPSPLGPLAAKAHSENYAMPEEPVPYHGYYFRILTAQGKAARGGAVSYLVKGKMIGGFALVAYPAKYSVTGVKTFIVNHDGVVYEKNLGPKTAQKAKSMKTFNPDGTWVKSE